MEKEDGPLMATWKKDEWGEKGIGRRKRRGGERSKEGKEKEDEEKGEERRRKELLQDQNMSFNCPPSVTYSNYAAPAKSQSYELINLLTHQ